MKKFFVGLLLLLLIGGAGGVYFLKGRPSGETSKKYSEFSFISEDKDIDKDDFTRNDGMYYLSLDYIKENLDDTAYYDEKEETIVLVNQAGTKRIKLDEKSLDLNGKTIDLRQAAYKEGDKIYLPIESFIYDYPVSLRYVDQKKLLLLDFEDVEYAIGVSTGDGLNVRESDSTKSPIVAILKDNEEVYVYGEVGDFYKVRQKDGYLGYIRKDLLNVKFPENKFKLDKDQKKEAKKPLNLTWDYTYSTQSDSSIENIKAVPGLNVICPTWFSLENKSGDITDRGKYEYVKRYEDMGIDVWGYLDNSFDSDITHEVLKSSSKRQKAIENTFALVKKYNLKGINIDFEHTNIEDRDLITQFVREITGVFKTEGLIVSVDVTPQISGDVTKEPYDRKKLAEICDYVMVMAYDQHWSSSDKAGSVAEYSWVEGNLNNLFRTIPKEKLVLCIPFYSRLWEESGNSLKSNSISMDKVNSIVSQRNLFPKWDEEIKQSYVEYNENGKKYKLWIEDAKSLEYKTLLINKYNLAGVASWQKGLETPDVWIKIEEILSAIEYY
ncbi:glycosyl hydrolase family 18 protein [Peptoniphilus catoniae]|uniref:glycosyl hydrolase family 18 protein n=1 Tax=Peptoniphilus catoniae TaxID=1660341 RepID=UPI0010FCF3FD|nr:glycosyl hydrolase family 18 protein [Peptoniphilus catoniae]